MSDGGDLSFILGIRIRKMDDGSRTMDQRHYAEQTLIHFGMMDANHVSTLVEQGALEAMKINDEACDAGRYAEAVGSIMWMATMTRPDLAFAAALLARFTSAPTNRHWGAAKRALHYIKGTMDHGICFRAQGPGKITAFCNADWAGCHQTRA
ncbi:MAG: hypothetical protein BJ554DRAFT_1478 [Olpidium bornovanus]|uniref:Reverse transcriptase Ty1/copia-type domain-containing protein n=1 Tax=Olpidium bornovanus TaxID=278681 RepID=A0A8H8DHN7_9FUNG|nr:MAG: hypothetical protein BJ554DRAFT_1478 [Olpidium bornovanus]